MATPHDRREAGITAPQESGRRGPLLRVPFLLLAIACVVLPALPSSRVDALPIAVALANLAHVVLAFSLALALGGLLPSRGGSVRAWAAPLASFCLLAGVEAFQSIAPWGDPSTRDLLGDAAGALAASAWLLPRERVRRSLRAGLAVIGSVLALPAVFEAGSTLLSESRRSTRFPVLGDFEDAGELRAWRARGGASIERHWEHATRGSRSLGITFPAEGLSALVLNSPPGDWSSYSALIAELFNPGEGPVTIRLRVADWIRWRDPDDRFEIDLAVPPGGARLCVPLQAVTDGPRGRPLDLTSVQALVFLVEGQGSSTRLFLDDLRLVETAAGCRSPILISRLARSPCPRPDPPLSTGP